MWEERCRDLQEDSPADWDSPSAGIDLYQSLKAVVQPLVLPAPTTLCIKDLPGQLLCHPRRAMRHSSQ